jgi:hypothetical protein
LLWDDPEQAGEAVGQNGALVATEQQGIRNFSLYAVDIDDELATVLGEWRET